MNYTSILESLEDCFDMNVPYSDIAALVRRQLSDGGSWNVVQYSVTGYGDTQVPYSMSIPVYVMQPDYETVQKAQELMDRVENGETITQADTELPVDASYSTDESQTRSTTARRTGIIRMPDGQQLRLLKMHGISRSPERLREILYTALDIAQTEPAADLDVVIAACLLQ